MHVYDFLHTQSSPWSIRLCVREINKAAGKQVSELWENSEGECMSFLYPYGATLNVEKPSVAVLSSGVVSHSLWIGQCVPSIMRYVCVCVCVGVCVQCVCVRVCVRVLCVCAWQQCFDYSYTLMCTHAYVGVYIHVHVCTDRYIYMLISTYICITYTTPHLSV